MKKILLSFTCTVFAGLIYSQTPGWSWASSSGSEGSKKRGMDISADSQSNTYNIGTFKDTIYFGSTQLFATQGTVKGEVFIAKYDASGSVIWAIQSTGGSNPQGNGIYTDANGNSYITGAYQNTISFGSLSKTSTNVFGLSLYIAKIDANGTPIWLESYAAPSMSFSDAIVGMCINSDASGDIYVSGNYKGTIDFGNSITLTNTSAGNIAPFVLKVNGSGVAQWAYGTTGGSFADVDVNDIEIGTDVYIAGTFKGSIYFGTNDTITNTSNREPFIAKFSTSGVFDWVYQPTVTGGSGNVVRGTGVGVDNQNNAYLCGFFSSDITFGATPTLSCGSFSDNTFIAKFSPTGSVLWATQIGEQGKADIYAVDMYTAVDGVSYISGSMTSSGGLYGAIIGNDTLNAVGGDVGDLFAAKIDANGVPIWGVKADNPAGYGDGSNCIVGTGNGIYLNGFYKSNLTFGSTVLTENNPFNENFFVARINENAAVGIIEEDFTAEIFAFPNPFKNVLTVKNAEGELLNIKLVDITGKIVSTKLSSDTKIELNTSNLPQGIYFLNVTDLKSGSVITTQKVIKH